MGVEHSLEDATRQWPETNASLRIEHMRGIEEDCLRINICWRKHAPNEQVFDDRPCERQLETACIPKQAYN